MRSTPEGDAPVGLAPVGLAPVSLAPVGLPARLVRASWAVLGVLTVASLVGTAFSPLLLVKAPLLLVVLAPDGRHVALIAGRVDPWLLTSVAVLRRSLYSVAVYGLGLAYGDVAVSWIEARVRRLGKALRALERLFARVGAVLLLILPFLSVCVLAGASRTRLRVFLPALVFGHFLWAFTTIWLGTRFAAQTQAIVDFFSERLFESTLVCVVLVAGYQLITRKRTAPP
jgi:membrane protein DedA with SNARE-associated domain